MEQLVQDREHLERRMEDNISDGSLDRDGDCDSKPQPDSGMDRQLSPMESTIFRSRKRLDLMTWLKLLKMYGAKEWLRHKLTGFFLEYPITPSSCMYVENVGIRFGSMSSRWSQHQQMITSTTGNSGSTLREKGPGHMKKEEFNHIVPKDIKMT